MGKPSAMPVVSLQSTHIDWNICPLFPFSLTGCTIAGLYYKLHGVHRPVTMKKLTIKRRKRITANPIIGDQGNPPRPWDIAREIWQSGGPGDHSVEVNSDGSVALPQRSSQSSAQERIDLSPAPSTEIADKSTAHQQRPSAPPSMSAGGARTPDHNTHDETRLAALTMAALSKEGAVSPPARNRSFSPMDASSETSGARGRESVPTRGASIKSMLNPSDDAEDEDVEMGGTDDRGGSGGYGERGSGVNRSGSGSSGPSREDGADVGREEHLRKEVEKMREMLAAKERELAAARGAR